MQAEKTSRPYFLLSDQLFTDTDVARLTGRARKTLQKDRLRGGDESIPFIRLGRLVRYRLSDVEKFLAERPTLRSTTGANDLRKSRDLAQRRTLRSEAGGA